MNINKLNKIVEMLENLEVGYKIVLNNPLQYKMDSEVHSLVYYDDGVCDSVHGDIIPRVGVQISRIVTIPKTRFVEVAEIFKTFSDDYFVKTVEGRYYPLICNINHLIYLIEDGYKMVEDVEEVVKNA